MKKIFFDTWHGTCFWEKVTFLLKFQKNPKKNFFFQKSPQKKKKKKFFKKKKKNFFKKKKKFFLKKKKFFEKKKFENFFCACSMLRMRGADAQLSI